MNLDLGTLVITPDGRHYGDTWLRRKRSPPGRRLGLTRHFPNRGDRTPENILMRLDATDASLPCE
jgi:hypothetical protein